MYKRPRDSQRQKVYDTEREHSLWKKVGYSTLSKQAKMGFCENAFSYNEVIEFVDFITSQKWFKNAYPNVLDIFVKDGRGRKNAAGWPASWDSFGYGKIAIPRWARHRLVILHEIAHVVTHHKHAWHGRQFCENFLFLIYFVIDQKAGNEMEKLFIKNKVKY